GKRLDYVGARVQELAMQFLDDTGMVQDNLGDERPGLEVPAPLALEEVPLRAHHGAAFQHRRQIRHGSSSLLASPARARRPGYRFPRCFVMHEKSWLAPPAARRQTGAMPTPQSKDGCTQAWAAANPRSKAHAQRASRVLPGGVTHESRRASPFPLAVARADGAHKWDLDGHEIICYVMGHGALLLGHSHPEVVAA